MIDLETELKGRSERRLKSKPTRSYEGGFDLGELQGDDEDFSYRIPPASLILTGLFKVIASDDKEVSTSNINSKQFLIFILYNLDRDP